MKKNIYLSLCALFVVTLCSLKAGATGIISAHTDMGWCYMPFDSLQVTETGYVATDSIIMDYGDGTSDTSAPFWVAGTTAYYSPSHYYTAAGTYTKKIVLLSGGVRVDSVSYSYYWAGCHYMGVALYNDVNSDCIFDAGDNYMWFSPARVEIDSAGVPMDTVTASYWVGYSATGPSGTVYTFKVINNPHGYLPACPTSGIINFTVGTASYYFDSIGFKCDTAACLDNAIAANFSAGLTGAASHMFVSSSSCTASPATVTLTYSPKYTVSGVYGGSSHSVSGNVLTINISGLAAGSPQYLTAHFSPVGTLTLSDTVNTIWTITPSSGDCDTTNNLVVSADSIGVSYDPNHKSVQPNGFISAGDKLTYMIGFENTGTAPAENIHLMDTLSDNLDIRTIRQTASSSEAEMSLMTWSGHNIVKFDFPHIHLLDSSFHGQCDGFVEFTINAKSSLAPGTAIDNKAGIYFDVNSVVMTNPVENKIYPITTNVGKVTGNRMNVYPNPVSDVLTVSTDHASYSTMTISNTLGQVLITQQTDAKLTNVNVKNLVPGIYYIMLKGEGGTKVQKFEKL